MDGKTTALLATGWTGTLYSWLIASTELLQAVSALLAVLATVIGLVYQIRRLVKDRNKDKHE